jgi:hypothetical protein
MTENSESPSTANPAAYPYFGVPSARPPRPAATEPSLFGKRVILSTPDGFVHDMRAASERYVDDRARDVLDVATEEDYFRWMHGGEAPPIEAWPAHLTWVEP